MQYRQEIDGLRAIAVIPVMLFHAGFQAFSGGFVGVDVFFAVLLFVGIGLCIVAFGWKIYARSGFVDRWPELNDHVTVVGPRLNAVYNEGPFRYANAEFSDAQKIHVLVIGNSFARDFINSALENQYLSSSEIVYSNQFASCLKYERDVDQRIRQLVPQADYIIFGSPPALPALDCWNDGLRVFRELGAKSIIVIGIKNFGWNLNAVMRLPSSQRYSYRARVREDIWLENEAAAQSMSNAYFVNLLALLADDDRRVPVFTNDGKLISQDTTHLTKAGAKFFGRILFEHPLLIDLK